MKAFGILFILCSTGYIGFHLSNNLKRQTAEFRQLQQCLQIIRNEIAFCGTPIPRIFGLLSEHTTNNLHLVFSKLSENMNKDKNLQPSEALSGVQAFCQDPAMVSVLERLTSKLGSYDIDAQLSGIEQTKLEVQEKIHQLEKEQQQKGKAYEGLGICAGLALAILLF